MAKKSRGSYQSPGTTYRVVNPYTGRIQETVGGKNVETRFTPTATKQTSTPVAQGTPTDTQAATRSQAEKEFQQAREQQRAEGQSISIRSISERAAVNRNRTIKDQMAKDSDEAQNIKPTSAPPQTLLQQTQAAKDQAIAKSPFAVYYGGKNLVTNAKGQVVHGTTPTYSQLSTRYAQRETERTIRDAERMGVKIQKSPFKEFIVQPPSYEALARRPAQIEREKAKSTEQLERELKTEQTGLAVARTTAIAEGQSDLAKNKAFSQYTKKAESFGIKAGVYNARVAPPQLDLSILPEGYGQIKKASEEIKIKKSPFSQKISESLALKERYEGLKQAAKGSKDFLIGIYRPDMKRPQRAGEGALGVYGGVTKAIRPSSLSLRPFAPSVYKGTLGETYQEYAERLGTSTKKSFIEGKYAKSGAAYLGTGVARIGGFTVEQPLIAAGGAMIPAKVAIGGYAGLTGYSYYKAKPEQRGEVLFGAGSDILAGGVLGGASYLKGKLKPSTTPTIAEVKPGKDLILSKQQQKDLTRNVFVEGKSISKLQGLGSKITSPEGSIVTGELRPVLENVRIPLKQYLKQKGDYFAVSEYKAITRTTPMSGSKPGIIKEPISVTEAGFRIDKITAENLGYYGKPRKITSFTKEQTGKYLEQATAFETKFFKAKSIKSPQTLIETRESPLRVTKQSIIKQKSDLPSNLKESLEPTSPFYAERFMLRKGRRSFELKSESGDLFFRAEKQVPKSKFRISTGKLFGKIYVSKTKPLTAAEREWLRKIISSQKDAEGGVNVENVAKKVGAEPTKPKKKQEPQYYYGSYGLRQQQQAILEQPQEQTPLYFDLDKAFLSIKAQRQQLATSPIQSGLTSKQKQAGLTFQKDVLSRKGLKEEKYMLGVESVRRQTVAQKPKSRLKQGSGLGLGRGRTSNLAQQQQQRQRQTPEQINILSPISDVLRTPATKPKQTPIFDFGRKQRRDMPTRFDYPRTPSLRTPPPKLTTPEEPPFKPFLWTKGRPKPKVSGLKQKSKPLSKYTPSFEAVLYNIRGKKARGVGVQPGKLYSGQELRPIVRRRSRILFRKV